MSTSGKIGVTTENIFPVIKKFLYSDHEIFLRELVSNAVDATQKLKTLYSFGDYKGELGEMKVTVTVDKEAGTLTVTDRGVGMTKEEVDKYINQIAFSGAEEFLEKYKNTANTIIGHFGLGFYSSFMVSTKVEIRTLSYKEGSKAVLWSCDGSPEYTMEECDKTDRGTEITLYIDEENKEFLEQIRIDTLLKKYCRFLPIPVVSGKIKEWKDGKYVDSDKDNVVNSMEPLWTKKPADITEEDYKKFYHELMPGAPEPIFHIHLNVDYPFTLTGILYFPQVNNTIDIERNNIQLYCNQVFVTDKVDGVVPEFMSLMQGVIDSPDIPLNVSRSYLQSDSNVKKISTYITKKLAEKLEKMFRDDRKAFEEKWPEFKIFIEYGMIMQDKFFDLAKPFYLVKDVNGKYYTLDEYKDLVKDNQENMYHSVIYLYTTDKKAQYPFIKAAEDKGYNVLEMDGHLYAHMAGKIERGYEQTRFVRVDSDVIDKLIEKEDSPEHGLESIRSHITPTLFRSQIPALDNKEFTVSIAALGEKNLPAVVTQNEFARRMKDMMTVQTVAGAKVGGKDKFDLVVNVNHPAVKYVIETAYDAIGSEIKVIRDEIDVLNDGINAAIRRASEKAKAEEEAKKAAEENSENIQEVKETEVADTEEKKEDEFDSAVAEKRIMELLKEQERVVSEYAETLPEIREIIDLSLLQKYLISGEKLNEFIFRTAEMLKTK